MTALTSEAELVDRLSAGLYAVLFSERRVSAAAVFSGYADDRWVNLCDLSAPPVTRKQLWELAESRDELVFVADHAFRVDTVKRLRSHAPGSVLVAGEYSDVYRLHSGDLHRVAADDIVDVDDFWALVDPGSVLVIWDSREYVPF